MPQGNKENRGVHNDEFQYYYTLISGLFKAFNPMEEKGLHQTLQALHYH